MQEMSIRCFVEEKEYTKNGREISIMKWLRDLSLRNKFSIIISLILLILLFGLVNFWFGMKVMSSIRSYVGGEGLWSKAQKEAVNNLVRYSNSFEEADYQNFLRFLEIPQGDKQARLELEKKNPDLAIARQGFIQGGNNPEDVDDLIFLYRWFRHISYMETAIAIWTEGDAENAKLLYVGEELHVLVLANQGKKNFQNDPVFTARRTSLLQEAYQLDSRLTLLENRFSATLGEGSRRIRDLLFIVTIVLTILLGAIALSIAIAIEKIIVQVDKAKSEFVSLASHQLRTPITIISWYVEKIIKNHEGINPQQKNYLDEVYAASRRMVALINALLNASRIELGTLKVELTQVTFSQIANQVLQDLHPQIEGKAIVLESHYQENLPTIAADTKLLTIIIQNLLSNAIKYTPQNGKVTFSISANQKGFLIQVADTGCGIPLSQRSKIFKKMFRADNARSIDPEGTGLGLYIVKAITDATKGRIWFITEENKGTTFYVTFPLLGMQTKTGKK
jgi:signal transduction histidine kinase